MPNLRCFTPTIPSSNDMIFIQGSSCNLYINISNIYLKVIRIRIENNN